MGRRDLGPSKNLTVMIAVTFDAVVTAIGVVAAVASAWPGVGLALAALALSVGWQVTAIHTIERLPNGGLVLRGVAGSQVIPPGDRPLVRQSRIGGSSVLVLQVHGHRRHAWGALGGSRLLQEWFDAIDAQ